MVSIVKILKENQLVSFVIVRNPQGYVCVNVWNNFDKWNET